MSRRPVSVLCVVGGMDPEFGGTSAAVEATCAATQRAGVSTTLAYAASERAVQTTAPARRRLVDAGVEVHAFPLVPVAEFKAARWGISPRLAAWLAGAVRRHDVVHLH